MSKIQTDIDGRPKQGNSSLGVVRHLLTVLKNGYEFNATEVLFNNCDEMAKFIGFQDFKDLQKNLDTPKTFEIVVNCA